MTRAGRVAARNDSRYSPPMAPARTTNRTILPLHLGSLPSLAGLLLRPAR